MTCSLQTYRLRIGTFQPRPHIKKKTYNSTDSKPSMTKNIFILKLLVSIYCMIILTVQMLLPPPGVNNHQPVLQPPSSYTCYSARVRTDIRVNIFMQPWNSSLTLYAWDPGPKTRNKRAHITNGNKGERVNMLILEQRTIFPYK